MVEEETETFTCFRLNKESPKHTYFLLYEIIRCIIISITRDLVFPRENNFISLFVFSIFKNHHDILIEIKIISIKTFVR